MEVKVFTKKELRGRHGVYQITNTMNGKFYVGSAIDLYARVHSHRHDLRKGKHHSCYLQRAYDKYGESAFVFSVLEFVDDQTQCVPREQFYLDTLKPKYNISKVAGSRLGVLVSEKTRRLLSIAGMGRVVSVETRMKLSKAGIGRVCSSDTRRKLRERSKSRVVSEETKLRLRSAFKGHAHSVESKLKISMALKGKTMSEETKIKMSEAKKGQIVSDVTRSAVANANSKRVWTDEMRKKMSEKIKLIKSKKKLQQL